jgi:hypothetical protein
MWTMANRIVPQMCPRLNTIYNSPFEKMKKTNQNINKIKVNYEGNPLKQIKNFNDGQIHNSPFHFDVNLYFGNPKSSFTPIHPNENFLYPHHNEQNQNIPVCFLFKTSLEKSGYKLTPEQTVQYKDIYKKSNSINSFYDDFNCYYFPVREFPMNSNNNIINNIYPTFTKVTNVQIIPDNDKTNNEKNFVNNKIKNNPNITDLENKKENINENNIDKKTIMKEIKKNINNNVNVIINDNENNENKKQKVIFECSESNGSNSPVSAKTMLKKKRLRKNNEQLGLLSKFYTENKNWSKKQIKEISESIGLKENKIYKWLWDQKNKEYKVTKFVVNKDKDKNE